MTTPPLPISLDHATFLQQMEALSHKQRSRQMIALGRRSAEPEVAALLGQLESGDAYQRRLAIMSCYTARDGARVLRGTQDSSRHVRRLALNLAGLCCSGDQALEALKLAWELGREDRVAQSLYRQGERAPIGPFLDWLADRAGQDATIDLQPLAEEEVLRRWLPVALARPSARFWKRMAGCAPAVLVEVLIGWLKLGDGEPDTLTRELIEAYQQRLAWRAPDATLALAEALLERRIRPQPPTLSALIRLRPEGALDLFARFGLLPPASSFVSTLDRLSLASICRLARWVPEALGSAAQVAAARPRGEWADIARAWAEALERSPAWGIDLISAFDKDDPVREALYQSWSLAARDKDGITPGSQIERLPHDLVEREGRRHVYEVVALRTRPPSRLFYIRYLPWEEAEGILRDWLGHPDGGLRGIALYNLLYIPIFHPSRPELTDRSLALVLARKNEQDPVRCRMLEALQAWPKPLWRPDHLDALGRIMRDALDAADLSHGTASHLEAVIVRRFGLDGARVAKWLHTLLKERGQIYDPRLGAHIGEAEIALVGPYLLDIAKIWAGRDRDRYLVPLLTSLNGLVFKIDGMIPVITQVMATTPHAWTATSLLRLFRDHDRAGYLALLPAWISRWLNPLHCGVILSAFREEPHPIPAELVEAVEKIAFFNNDSLRSSVLEALYKRLPDRLAVIVERLIALDRSNVIIPRVAWLLSRHRQDLLTPFLTDARMTGRAASGKTSWVMLWEGSYYRWTPAQNALYRAALTTIVADRDRDTPTILTCQGRLSDLCYGPDDQLNRMADDDRPVVQERALRVLARCDESRGLTTLLRCLEDARARIAIYGLRRALKELPGSQAMRVLDQVPLRKVTVSKEVVRLLGELRAPAAFARLVSMDTPDLHRDVRIALLRALWDHFHRDETWSVFERAATGPDWVLASRVGDVPPDRLTERTDRMLSAVMAKVVRRPEPEARLELLQRAAHLPMRDRDRTFLAACRERIHSPYDDEVRAATLSQLHRSAEADVPAWGQTLATLTDARAWTVLIDTLIAQNPHTRGLYLDMAKAAAAALTDPRWAVLRLRLEAAAAKPAEVASVVAAALDRAAPTPDGGRPLDLLNRATVEIQNLPPGQHRAAIHALLPGSPDHRRLAVSALERDAAPGRGWSEPRRALLAKLRLDGDPGVAGAAGLIFPPREQDVEIVE